MNKIKLVAIDLAKRCYQVGAIDQHGKLMFNRKLLAGEVCAGDAAARADDRGDGSVRSSALLGSSLDRHWATKCVWYHRNMPRHFAVFTRAMRTIR